MERTDFEQWKSKEVARLLALVETERRYYQEMVALLPAPVAVLSAVHTILYANRAFRQQFNLRGEELRRLTIGQILPGAALEEKIREAHASGTPPEPVLAQSQGRSYRISLVPTRNWDDETELETLLLAEEVSSAPGPAPRTEPFFSADIPAAVWQADSTSLAFTHVSAGAERMLGYPTDQWLSDPKFFEERILADDRAAVLDLYRATLATGGDASAEFRALTAAGELVWCRESIRVAPPGNPEENAPARPLTGVLTDITRRKEVEQRLLVAGRIDALQTISGRLAHDLNNPLMIATGYAEELVNTLPEGSPLRADAEEIVNSTARIAAIAAQLNGYSRRTGSPVGPVDIQNLFAELQPAFASETGLTLEVTPSLSASTASADRDQLSGLLLALASPAREGAQDRTRLHISWITESLTEHVPGATLAPGKYVRITFRDDGRGLARGRDYALFEAVLLEKEPSSISTALARGYTLVHEWGGDIAVSSMVGQGTTVSLYLPHSQPLIPEHLKPTETAPAPQPQPEPLREAILVVDDEAGIRGLVRKILKREHYQVLEAGSAEEALTIAVSRAAPIELLLTDVKLPGLSGPDLARRMYEASPDLKVLYISGYTEDPSVRAGEFPPGARFLAKPFTLSALLKAVRETLDA